MAALVPRPTLHLIRSHGVLAPNAWLRAQVVPAGHDDDGTARPVTEAFEPHDPHPGASRIGLARLLKWSFDIYPEDWPNGWFAIGNCWSRAPAMGRVRVLEEPA